MPFLCNLSRNIPIFVSNFLERDRHVHRNFKEETITDIITASFLGHPTIHVDLPDEPTTGGDMEWIFISYGRKKSSMIRLIIQSKRSFYHKLKVKPSYWAYDQLDHGKGSQVNTLISYCSSCVATLPIYMFYNPTSACMKATAKARSVDGINWTFGKLVHSVASSGCGIDLKKVTYWQNKSYPLSTWFCPSPPLSSPIIDPFLPPTPGDIALTINNIIRDNKLDIGELSPTENVPAEFLRKLDGQQTRQDRESITRPRVIFQS